MLKRFALCLFIKLILLLQISIGQVTDVLYPVKQNNKWGYIDRSGEIRIKPQFDFAGQFHEGLAAVSIGTVKYGRTGYMDSKGNPVSVDRIGYIDINGNFVINPQFAVGFEFSEGLASVSFDSSVGQKWGYIDKSGKMILNPLDFYDSSNFNEGLAMIRVTESKGTKFGYMNKKGKVVIKAQYYQASDFSEGLAPVKDSFGSNVYFIDTTGKVVLKTKYLSADSFSEGLSNFRSPFFLAFSSIGYINREGKVVYRTIRAFKMLFRFSEGLARVAIEKYPNYQYGYIDKKGKEVIPIQFDKAKDFYHGLAMVEINSKIGYIDKTGNYVWALQK